MFYGFYKGKRVFVTGHTGFKGSWLTQWLLILGAEVGGYSSYIPSDPSNYEILGLKHKMHDFRNDIRNLDDLRAAVDEFRPEIIFHLAAQPIVTTSFEQPRTTFEVNLGGTINVLEVLMKESGVKVGVLITSDKCYENVEWEFGYRENDRLGGKDPYSASKACAEIAVSAYFRSYFDKEGMPRIATTRAGNVIGGGDWAKNRIVPDCVRAWSLGDKVTIRSPHATRPWQHVLEPLSGYLLLAQRMWDGTAGLNGEAFNFGPMSSVNQPVKVLIETMRKYWEGKTWVIDPSVIACTGKEAGLLKLNCDKAYYHLRWEPTLTFEETIKATTEWYRHYYEGADEMSSFTERQIRYYADQAKLKGRVWAM